MDLLVADIVKEFLKARGLNRTLKAFEVSLLTAAPPAARKAAKFTCSLEHTDEPLPLLERMVCGPCNIDVYVFVAFFAR